MTKKPKSSRPAAAKPRAGGDGAERSCAPTGTPLPPEPQTPQGISIDVDGIITVHRRANVWPYDRNGTTAVQLETPAGYILVTVRRYDHPTPKS